MARSIIFVNNSGTPWTLGRFGGAVVPATGTLDVTTSVSDDELVSAIQKGLGDEFTAQRYLRVGGVDKSAAESKEFLTPGQTGGSPVLGPTGSISAAEHGNQAGGSLHSIATGAVAGFMSASDKTKLDAVQAGAVPLILWTPGDANGPGTNVQSQTASVIRYGIFRGTNAWTPNIFRIIASTTGATGYVDIYDSTNGQVIATIAVSGAIAIYSTSTLNNLPANQAIIALRAYRGGTATTVTVHYGCLTRE